MPQTAKNTVTYGLGNVKLAPTDEIIGFEINVVGGGFESMSSLPRGWRVAINNKSATETAVNADLSFGSETLGTSGLREVVLKFSQAEGQAFKLLGHLLVTNGASERRVSLAQANFISQ